MLYAEYETAHFTFYGIYDSEQAAVEAITGALYVHAQEYSSADVEVMTRTLRDDLSTQEVEPGFTYRRGGAGDDRILADLSTCQTLLDLLKLQRDPTQQDRFCELRHRYIQSAARRFSQILFGWFTPEQRALVLKRNESEEYRGACASHDFCDANEAMAEALVGMGLDPMPTGYSYGEHGESMAPVANEIWNEAWALAKANRFWWQEARVEIMDEDPAEDAAHAAVRHLFVRLGFDPQDDLGGMADLALDGAAWDALVDALSDCAWRLKVAYEADREPDEPKADGSVCIDCGEALEPNATDERCEACARCGECGGSLDCDGDEPCSCS